jgi:glutathione S-transferase
MEQSLLTGLRYSPWTERARWALDHHGISYDYQEHVPMLGEPLLRWRARGLAQERVTVPLYRDGTGVFGDSLRIAERADAKGRGPRLLVDPDQMAHWNARVEDALSAMRALVTARLLADRDAVRESALAVSPRWAAGALSPVVSAAARFVAHKYGADLGRTEAHEETMGAVLRDIREARGGRMYFAMDRLTAPDIWMATALQGVVPVYDSFIRLEPAVRRAWTSPKLAAEFSDLVGWRDALYAACRGRRTRPAA